MRFACIREHIGIWRIRSMCRALNVSTSGFYAWCRRPVSPRAERDRDLRLRIVAFHAQSKRRYGSRPIVRDLRDMGERVSRRRVAKLMREAGIRGKTPRSFKVTTDSSHRKPLAENLLDRHFAPLRSRRRIACGRATSRICEHAKAGSTSQSCSIFSPGVSLAGR